MSKTKATVDPYLNLASDVIIDAIAIAAGQTAATERERMAARRFLESEKCSRWAGVIGVDWDVAMERLSRTQPALFAT